MFTGEQNGSPKVYLLARQKQGHLQHRFRRRSKQVRELPSDRINERGRPSQSKRRVRCMSGRHSPSVKDLLILLPDFLRGQVQSGKSSVLLSIKSLR